MSTLTTQTVTDGIKTGLSLFSADKATLKEMFSGEDKKENFDHLFYKNGSCYFISTHEQTKNQKEARSFCQAIGTNNFSRLYEFKNKIEYEYLLNKTMRVFNKHGYASFYFGLEKVNETNTKQVKWTSGRNLSSFEESAVFFDKEISWGYSADICFVLTIRASDDFNIEPVNCRARNQFICRFGKIVAKIFKILKF